MSILAEIVARRRERIGKLGHAMGAPVPRTRTVPVVPFGADPFLVCEVKRRSPSRGDIARVRDARAPAREYAARGARSISVLTETDHFGGSLDDLVRIKEALPGVSVLRKDFLLDVEDIDVSWRAGADAVLLIASILSRDELAAMYHRARGLGLQALVEVHDEEDVRKCRPVAPDLTGINCRDLSTFAVDLLHPLKLTPSVDWDTRLLFESGIRSPADVRLALAAGFRGVLVGETAMRSPETLPSLLSAFGSPGGDFWARLCRRARPGRPMVKICGIARAADAELAVSLGADVLGFVFAESPRRASIELLREIRDLEAIKVAVVVTADGELGTLRGEGLVDAVQFHGGQGPEECAAFAFPWYKAVRVSGPADVAAMDRYGCPRVLADAFSPAAAGGTGQGIPADLVAGVKARGPLWLAGGLGPDNVGAAMKSFAPELIDASSRLEASPGRKDREKMREYFREIDRNAQV